MKTLLIVGFWLSWLLAGCVQASGITRIDQVRGPLAVASHAPGASEHIRLAHQGLARADYREIEGLDYLSPGSTGQAWFRVLPASFSGERVLAVYHPYSAQLTVLVPPDYRPQSASIFDTATGSARSRRALLFELEAPGPVYVGVSGARYPLRVAVEPTAAYDIADYSHVRVLWASMGVLLGVSLVVLLFWLLLRDRVYLMFAASMLMQSLYVLCAYGDAYTLPGLRWLAHFGVEGIWFVATSATMLSVVFLVEFAGLLPRAPRMTKTLYVVGGWLPAAALIILGLPWPADNGWFPSVGNGLLLAANALAIATLLTVWLRGGRHAGFVLIAWVPIEIVSTSRAVQLSAGMPLSPWLEYGLPVLLAFAAVVLVLGLADRMLVLRRERDAAQQDAGLDALTGVSNRRAIVLELERAVLAARADGQSLWVLFLDLDHFKGINDNHGHAVGDACLLRVASVIRANIEKRQVGRLGGEEFLVLLPGCNRREARDIAERIRRAVEADCARLDSAKVGLTVSAGMVAYRDNDDAARLMARADEAMYQAKRAGRNRVEVLEED